jgi:hypothetical protein
MGLRQLYVTGMGYLMLCASVLALDGRSRERAGRGGNAAVVRSHLQVALAGGSPAAAWFAAMKPYCNALEVETRVRAAPPPEGVEGAGYKAACLALAGKIRPAQTTIDALGEADRWRAAGIVFDVGHPVADQGDDQSAGPMMRLVLRYWPNNYMALYHAGMSAYVLGDDAQGRRDLEEFLRLYTVNDSFTQRARAVLAGERPLPGSHE